MTRPEPIPLSLPARIVLALLSVVVFAAGIALSAVFFALFLVLALIGAVWLWWQRRRFRRRARQGRGDYIEVEYEVLEQRRSSDTGSDSARDRD